jgi:thiosulfate/3-mercaptopyruvate sulfurtransferase
MSRQQVLVDADWLEEHAGDYNIVVVEVDEDTTAYDGGHIKGAIKLDWKKDLQDPVRRDFVNKEQFEKLLSERGVSNDDTVVLYGGNNNWFAAYAYWYFKLYGHEKALLLDGGRKKWELDARELSTEQVTRHATSYTAKEPNLDMKWSRPSAVEAWSTSEAPTSTPAGCSPRPTSRRNRPNAADTSQRRSTCPGARPRMTTVPSSPTTNSRSSTAGPA